MLQKKEGNALTWEGVTTQNVGRMEANVTAPIDEDVHFRVLVHTQRDDVTGEFEFDVLCSSPTCTKQSAATSLNPRSMVETGSSIVLRWPPLGEVTRRQGDDLRMHSDSLLTIYLRKVQGAALTPSRTGSTPESQGSVGDDDVEAGEDTLFNPVTSDKLEVRRVRWNRAHLSAY